MYNVMLNLTDSLMNVSAASSLVYKEPMVLISIDWRSNLHVSPIIGTFFVSINPPIEMGSNFNTTNTSIQLIVLYNKDYNISVAASDCAGNRNLIFVDLVLNIGKIFMFQLF